MLLGGTLIPKQNQGVAQLRQPAVPSGEISELGTGNSDVGEFYRQRLLEVIGSRPIAEFARQAQVAHSTLRAYVEEGSLPTWETAIKIARAARRSLDWFAAPQATSVDLVAMQTTAEYLDQSSFCLVPLFDVRASAGHGAWNDHERVTKQLAFRREWISSELGSRPDDLTLIYVDGDSMEPRFSAGDVVMVDRSARDVRADGVYVFLLDDQLLIKHLQRLPGGRLRAISENRTYEPFEIDAGSLGVEGESTSYIIGRVVWGGVRV